MSSGSFAYITLGSLRAELLTRLQDPSALNVSVAEANIYIAEALRVLNSLTNQWNANFVFNFNPGDTWKTLNVPASPRQRTILDSYLYTQMEAMLMEPMSGSTWTGTAMYNIGLLSAALQYRREELLFESAANTVNLLEPSPVLSARTFLPDSTLDLLRVRWVPGGSSNGAPYVLGREDAGTLDAFLPNAGAAPGNPDSWIITANAPLAFDVSTAPAVPGTWDMLAAFAGVAFNPPAAAFVGVPDDWTWVAMYGALADVLANSPEGRDELRSKYCLRRYEQGRKAMRKMPWLIDATVAGVSVDTPSYFEQDTFMQNWEQLQPSSDPLIVVGGVDFVALAPFVPAGKPVVSSVLTVVGNAPIPANDSVQVQLSREGVDQVLNYAQHLASFKLGGTDFLLTMPLYEEFEAYCRRKNAQYAALGIFRPDLLDEGQRAEEIDPRFIPRTEEVKRGTKAG